MRLLLKLSASVALAVVLQGWSVRIIGLLDEAQFAAHMFAAEKLGTPPDAPALLDAADRLQKRQFARMLYEPPRPTFEPAVAWWNRRDGWANQADSS